MFSKTKFCAIYVYLAFFQSVIQLEFFKETAKYLS